MKNILLVGVFLFSSFANAEAPFGLKIGMALSEAQKVSGPYTTIAPNYYMFMRVPKAVSGFSSYAMLITPKSGLCKVAAAGKTLDTNVYGDGIKTEYADIKASLTKKYGTPSGDYDYLRAGSIWKEPNDWTMGLYKEERVLASIWDVNDPNGVKSILLNTVADTGNSGYVSLTYELANIQKCSLEKKSRDTSGL